MRTPHKSCAYYVEAEDGPRGRGHLSLPPARKEAEKSLRDGGTPATIVKRCHTETPIQVCYISGGTPAGPDIRCVSPSKLWRQGTR